MRGTGSGIKGGRGSGPGKQPAVCYRVVLATSHVFNLRTGFVNIPCSVATFEFCHNPRLITRIKQKNVKKIQRFDQGLNPDHFLCCQLF